MTTELVHVGFGNILAMNRVVALLAPTSEHSKRLVELSRSKGMLLNMTNGRRISGVVLLDTGHIILTAISPETIAGRLASIRSDHPAEERLA